MVHLSGTVGTLPCSASSQTGRAALRCWSTGSCCLCHSKKGRLLPLLPSEGTGSSVQPCREAAQPWAEDGWNREGHLSGYCALFFFPPSHFGYNYFRKIGTYKQFVEPPTVNQIFNHQICTRLQRMGPIQGLKCNNRRRN